jgi:hypothetical protein
VIRSNFYFTGERGERIGVHHNFALRQKWGGKWVALVRRLRLVTNDGDQVGSVNSASVICNPAPDLALPWVVSLRYGWRWEGLGFSR